MFYKQKDIDNGLTCGICSQIFDDPRILPCGNSACNKCIKFDSNHEFACTFCKEKHDNNGLLVNIALLKLIETRAEDVSRNHQNLDELKSKLEEISIKCNNFKYNLSNGEDQVKEHCLLLRNQVHLETDILIEQAHQFNEKIIEEINKYEKECIDSFNRKRGSYEAKSSKLLNEIKSFCEDKANYLTEFKIEDKTLADSLADLISYLKVLEGKEESLKKIKFGGKLLEFKKSEVLRDESLLGSLVYKEIFNFEFDDFKEIDLNKKDSVNYINIYHVFKQNNGSTCAFYHNGGFRIGFNFVSLDENGKIVSLINNLVTFLSFVIELDVGKYMLVAHRSVDFRGKQLNCNRDGSIAILTDENLNYISHKSLRFMIYMIKGNRSNIVFIDSQRNFCLCDLDINLVPDKSMQKVKEHVGNTLMGFEMNDQNLFFLCDTKKLKIFDLSSLQLVKEIDIHADQIKLLSSDFIFLFDSWRQSAYLLSQSGNFEKLHELDLKETIPVCSRLSLDKSKFVAFYSATSIKYKCFN